MHQSGVETVTRARDDLSGSAEYRAPAVNVGPLERSLSVVAGGALALSGLRRHSLPFVLGGASLIYRGATGFCPAYAALRVSGAARATAPLEIEETVTVQRPAEEVYSLWRQVENLPRFMSYLESVTAIDQRRSHWTARVPAPLRLEWDAEITDDQPGKRIDWRSLPGSMVDHAGSVLFHSLPARGATEVKLILRYVPPAGGAGAALAKFIEGLTEHQIREDLRAFKAVAETGEKPTTEGQPSGRK